MIVERSRVIFGLGKLNMCVWASIKPGSNTSFAALKQISEELPAAKRIGVTRFKEIVKEQYLMLLMDEEQAIAALPKLLPDDRRQCEEGLALVRRVLGARGALPAEGRRRLERIETMFAGPPPELGRENAA